MECRRSWLCAVVGKVVTRSGRTASIATAFNSTVEPRWYTSVPAIFASTCKFFSSHASRVVFTGGIIGNRTPLSFAVVRVPFKRQVAVSHGPDGMTKVWTKGTHEPIGQGLSTKSIAECHAFSQVAGGVVANWTRGGETILDQTEASIDIPGLEKVVESTQVSLQLLAKIRRLSNILRGGIPRGSNKGPLSAGKHTITLTNLCTTQFCADFPGSFLEALGIQGTYCLCASGADDCPIAASNDTPSFRKQLATQTSTFLCQVSKDTKITPASRAHRFPISIHDAKISVPNSASLHIAAGCLGLGFKTVRSITQGANERSLSGQ
mmetsp:Transcript_16680/g.45843  ORF Transcript_16680/g.45843 Transcript_16680/m.45843 type:complete len:322 (-) Transcript_16680:523-1488(-)